MVPDDFDQVPAGGVADLMPGPIEDQRFRFAPAT